MARSHVDLEEAKRRRAETSDRLVGSSAGKKLVVAGPGTGKTFNFRRALEAAGGGLAITFIRALARDLERDLGDLAQVNTFHGYCKHLAHRLGGTAGLTGDFDYYPGVRDLVAEDLETLGKSWSKEDIDQALHHLDDASGAISDALRLGNYYDAVGHTDVVYRVYQHLATRQEDIPEHPLIVVDEYQDFSHLEASLIDTLAESSPVLVAGDDDQALYGFKHASASYIREFAERDDVERFDLPYCSRCTEVIVDAVNSVVREAQARGNLAGRVDREYLCYLPEKLQDSRSNPTIIHAACTVEMNRAPYMGRYVVQQIGQIPADDIAESHEKRYPTALVVGRKHFVERVHAVVKEEYPHAILRTSSDFEIQPLDGYRRLARDPSSRLGWRILLHVFPSIGAPGEVRDALASGGELREALNAPDRERHLEVSRVVKRLLDGDEPSSGYEESLQEAIGMSLEQAATELSRDPDDRAAGQELPELGADEPSIMCTSLLGAKGLSAGHVFIVGFINGDFPAEPTAVTDDEACKFIVALSRTRKRCHLVSCGRFGHKWTEPSELGSWLEVPIDQVNVNKDYWQ